MATMARPAEPLVVRFWRNVQKTESCWEWTGAKDKDGYGKFQVPAAFSWDSKTHTTRATRAVLYLTSGQWPDKKFQVHHHCDNPSCVRPDHLKLGTAKENCVDMISRGRSPRQRGTWNGGIKNPEHAHLAILSWEKVRNIRNLYESGNYTKAELGREFGVSTCTISDIVKKRTWKE